MTAHPEIFAEQHGVLRRKDLARLGVEDEALKRSLSSGQLIRIRKGWYKHVECVVDPIIEGAVREGCAYSGPPALALKGAWDLNDDRVFYRAARKHHVLGSTKPIVLKRRQRRYVSVSAAVDPVSVAFEVALLNLPEAEIVILGDSLVNRKLLSITDLETIRSPYSRTLRTSLARVNGFADSGTETMVRLWLEKNGIPFVQQYLFRESERTDFLAGRRLIIEVDSIAHHASRESQQRDHSRDQYLKARGHIVFRVTYDDVTRNWAQASRQLLAIITRGDHLIPPHG